MTYAEAAALLGVDYSTVTAMVQRGDLTSRGRIRGTPSGGGALDRVEVLALADRRRAVAEAREAARAARADRVEAMRPPDDEQEWVLTREAAGVLGLSRARVQQLADAGRVPCTMSSGRRWFRRVDLEVLARVRAFPGRTRP